MADLYASPKRSIAEKLRSFGLAGKEIGGVSPARLRAFLALLLLALAVPSAVLIWQTRQQLRWESLHQYRTLAEEMAQRIDAELQRMLQREEARSDGDYRFLVLAGDLNTSTLVQRSELAELPDGAQFPGLLGHFQIDAAGAFSTPLLPDPYTDQASLGLAPDELLQRQQLSARLIDVLSRNQLIADRGDSPGSMALNEPKAVTEESDAALLLEDVSLLAKNELGDEGLDPQKRLSATAPAREQSGAEQAKVNQEQSQVAFDRLNSAPEVTLSPLANRLGRVDELKLDRGYADSAMEQRQRRSEAPVAQNLDATRGKRKEQSAIVESGGASMSSASASSSSSPTIVADELAAKPDADAEQQSAVALPTESAAPRVRIFESEVDPFEFGMLASGHGVLFRRVWRNGERTIQGMLFEQSQFIDGVIAQSFAGTALWQMSDLVVAHQQDVLQLLPGQAEGRSYSSASDVRGELLYQTRLSAPLDRLQLIWSIKRLPAGPGAQIVMWSGALLLVVLLGGFLALYKLGMRQILLARQQQDFVSAVSHELRTPLTSIRMYAEMLREGWASDDKKRSYYEFIHDESERLSRLIANVLQLARMERNELPLERRPITVSAVLDLLRSKLSSQSERAGFTLNFSIDQGCAERIVRIDADAFCQIVINLVDNAIKFSQGASLRQIDIGVVSRAEKVVFSVRDYGPGIAKSQLKKIFQLFYRPGNELTRESVGTGIGLALVRQLARAMGGEVEALNRQPGAEFQLCLPAQAVGFADDGGHAAA